MSIMISKAQDDVMKILILSNQHSKTQRDLIYNHIKQKSCKCSHVRSEDHF